MITFEEYQALKERGFTHVPLIKKRLMDVQTPVSVFSKVRDLNGSAYLFESVVGGERWARYSMIGLGSDLILQYTDGTLTIKKEDQIDIEMVENPFDCIRERMAQYKMPTATDIATLPSFSGGLVGYFGYDMVRAIQPDISVSDLPDLMSMPDMWLMLSTNVIVFDNLENTLSIIVYADCEGEEGYGLAIRELEKIEEKLAESSNLYAPVMPTPNFVSQTSKDQYCSDLDKIKSHIEAGEVEQVILAQRLIADYTGDSLAVYRALRYLNPSPYLFLVHGYTLDDHKRFDLIGASPEVLSRTKNGKVTVRPLAGTRPRGHDEAEDLAFEQALLDDSVQTDKHLRLIDACCHDMSSVCEEGSVRVTDKMSIDRYSQVMHIASNIEGALRADKDALDVFCATFPASTSVGAPKSRAMQLINDMEPVRRNIFGGSVGYLGWHGNMDAAVTISTLVMRRGKIHIQAGAEVTAESVSQTQWDESNKTASVLIKAVKMACNGLHIR